MEKITIPNKYIPQTEVKEAEIDTLFTKGLRLANGDQGVNKVLTCINNNGLADWKSPPLASVITVYNPPTVTSSPSISSVSFNNFNAVRLTDIIRLNFDLSFDFSGIAGVEYTILFSCPLISSNFTQSIATCNWFQKASGAANQSARLESNVGQNTLTLYVNPLTSGQIYEISVVAFVRII